MTSQTIVSQNLIDAVSNLWGYLSVGVNKKTCDVAFVLGRDDFSIPEKTAEIYEQGLAQKIVLLGGRGRLTGEIEGSESQAFKTFLLSKNIPEGIIFIEENCYIAPNISYFAKLPIHHIVKKVFKRMNSKKCVFCESLKVTKQGFQKGIQKWKCGECNKYFQANKKSLPEEEIFCSFVFHKQTFTELSKSYHIKINTLQKIFDEHVLGEKIHNPRVIYLVVDGTYFGTTGTPNAFCLVVFRDEENKEDIWWKFCEVETYEVYKEGRDHLASLGYIIKGVTADGLPLIRNVFRDIRFQMCLVHMERIIIRGTTKYPILEAGKVLLMLSSTLHTTNKDELRSRIIKYKEMYWTFLNEKAVSLVTGDTWFVHRELLKSFKSLYNLFPYLFTYEQDKCISKTTNSIEGHFYHIKTRVMVHHGLSLSRKQKLITAILLNSSVTLKEKD